jgi:hypothetical protein
VLVFTQILLCLHISIFPASNIYYKDTSPSLVLGKLLEYTKELYPNCYLFITEDKRHVIKHTIPYGTLNYTVYFFTLEKINAIKSKPVKHLMLLAIKALSVYVGFCLPREHQIYQMELEDLENLIEERESELMSEDDAKIKKQISKDIKAMKKELAFYNTWPLKIDNELSAINVASKRNSILELEVGLKKCFKSETYLMQKSFIEDSIYLLKQNKSLTEYQAWDTDAIGQAEMNDAPVDVTQFFAFLHSETFQFDNTVQHITEICNNYTEIIFVKHYLHEELELMESDKFPMQVINFCHKHCGNI